MMRVIHLYIVESIEKIIGFFLIRSVLVEYAPYFLFFIT